MNEWLLGKSLAAWLLPPGILLLALACALVAFYRRPRAARVLVLATLLVLYALSTRVVSQALLHLLEPDVQDPSRDRSGQAIVVLGSGIHTAAPEYGSHTITARSLVRLRYAARLQQTLRKPLLVSGGSPEGHDASEAALMKEALQRDFQARVDWTEDLSRNTLENARASYRILKTAGVSKIYLVTHAWHMPRARLAFEKVGFQVIPAPTGYATRPPLAPQHFLPDAGSLLESSYFFHELLGLGWYHLRLALGR